MWYTFMVAADRLGVPVVPQKEIKEVPMFWVQRALMASRAESDAAEAREHDRMKAMFGG